MASVPAGWVRGRAVLSVTLSALLAKRANAIRRLYAEGLDSIVELPLYAASERNLTVYTFSGARHVPEQVASLRSLIRNLGLPRRIVVVSDGTHSPKSARLIERVHPKVSVVDYRDFVRQDLPRAVSDFMESNPIGMKLAIELSIEVDRPTMYSDADVLLFPRIAELPDGALEEDARPRFLQDFDTRFLDARLLTDDAERQPPTNAGLLALFQPLSWDSALERFETVIDPRSREPESWGVEQTVVHLAMRASGGTPLPPDRYVLQVDDEHDWRDRYAGPDIALRHYCFSDPVQRKLWLHVWGDLAAAARSSPGPSAGAARAAALRWKRESAAQRSSEAYS